MARTTHEPALSCSRGRNRAGAALGVMALGTALALSPAPAAQAWPSPTGVITAYAGTGATADPRNGPALQSGFVSPTDVAADVFGNVYVADCGHTVSRIAPDGVLTVVAGNGSTGPAVPGPATRSPLDCPTSVALDAAGDVFFSDSGEHEIFKVTWNGVLSVVAGTGSAGAPVEGPATSSPLEDPTAIAVDGNGRDVFVADAHGGGRVYEINDQAQLVFVAGNGTNGVPVAGPALQSPLGAADGDAPSGIAMGRNGVLYLADHSNDVIEEVDSQGLLSVVAGRVGQSGAPSTPGSATSSDLADPVSVAVDRNGLVYIADAAAGSSTIERMSPGGELELVAGSGTAGTPAYGSAGTASSLDQPAAVAVNGAGTVFIADTGNRTIDRVGLATPSQPDRSYTTADGSSSALIIAPPEDRGTSPITGYQILFLTDEAWHDLVLTGTDGIDLPGLTDGVDYTFQIRAVNAAGPGPATPYIDAEPEVAQTRASAPGTVRVRIGASTAEVNWQAPVDPGDPGLTGYDVTVEDLTAGPTDGLSTQTTTADVLNAVVPGLPLTPGRLYLPGHRYEFLVNARGAGGDGDISTPVYVTTPSAPASSSAPAGSPARPVPLPPLAVTASQRRAEIAVPRNPLAYHGRLRHTVADGRSRSGTAAFAAATLGRYDLHAGQAVSVADASIFTGQGSTLSAHGRAVLRALAVDLRGSRTVTCEGYTDYAVARTGASALSRSRAAVVCRTLQAADAHTRTTPLALGGRRPAVIGGSARGRSGNARMIIDVTR